MSGPEPDSMELRIAPDSIEALASRIAELLDREPREPDPPTNVQKKMLSPAEVSELWGISRVWVYRHAEALGVRRMGSGTRPRLRFDPEEIEERLGAPRRRPPVRDMRRVTGIAETPHSNSLSAGTRAIVDERETDAAGGRANAPGPAPKEMLRRDPQPRPAGVRATTPSAPEREEVIWMAEQEEASQRHGEGGSEEQPLAFIDHHRQDYAQKVPMLHAGEFLIGDYRDDRGGILVGELGEFKVLLHHLDDRQGRLEPQLCVFGEGAEAFGVLLELAGGDLARLLRPVAGRDKFSRRLLDLGVRDASHKPLAEAA